MTDHVERALGPSEGMFWISDNVTVVNIVAHAEIEGRLEPDALRRGLAGLQARYPRLATAIEEAVKYEPRFRRTSDAIPLRVSTGDWQAEVNLELEGRFQAGQVPARCVLVQQGDNRSFVLLVIHHALGDGMSAMYLVRDLLLATAAPPGTQALVPSRDHGPVELLLPRVGSKLRIIWEVIKMTFRVVRPGLPHQIPKDRYVPARERRSHFASDALGAELTAALLERARREETTLQGAIVAAISMAIADEMPDKKKVRIDCLSPVNVRKDLTAPVEDALGLFVTTVPMVFPVHRPDDLWAVARRARNDLAGSIRRGEPLFVVSYVAWLSRSFARLALRRGIDKAAARMEGFGTPTFVVSNLGAVPIASRYDALSLRSVGFCAGVGFLNFLGVYVATVENVVRWSFVWTWPVVSDERARRIMQGARARLEAAVK